MRKIISITVGALLAVSLTVASAYFTGQAQVPDNVIRAGNVGVSTEPTASALSIDALAPGETQVRPITVRNTGTLTSDIVVSGAKKMGITDFYNALTCVVTHDGAVVYQGLVSGLQTAPVRLVAGGAATYQVAITLPASAGNDLAGDYVRMTLYVDAEQAH